MASAIVLVLIAKKGFEFVISAILAVTLDSLKEHIKHMALMK